MSTRRKELLELIVVGAFVLLVAGLICLPFFLFSQVRLSPSLFSWDAKMGGYTYTGSDVLEDVELYADGFYPDSEELKRMSQEAAREKDQKQIIQLIEKMEAMRQSQSWNKEYKLAKWEPGTTLSFDKGLVSVHCIGKASVGLFKTVTFEIRPQ